MAMLSITITRGRRRRSSDRACVVDPAATIRSGTPARRHARSMRRSYRLPPVRRATLPLTSSAAGSVVGEDHLHGVFRALVHELVRIRGTREGDAVRDERAEDELLQQREGGGQPPLAIPTRRKGRIDLRDLRADEAQSLSMEARAKVEAHRLGPVPRAHDDGCLERGGAED